MGVRFLTSYIEGPVAHQSLRLCSPGVEDAPSIVKNLENVGIFLSDIVPVAAKAAIHPKAFETDVFFGANWKAMERTDRLAVLREEVVQLLGPMQNLPGKQFGDTVNLQRKGTPSSHSHAG